MPKKKYKVIRSFVDRSDEGELRSFGMGDVIEVPDDRDWIKAGFVEEIKPKRKRRTKKKPETATKSKAENAKKKDGKK